MQKLNDLAVKYGSDKHSGHHDYCGAYEDNLGKFRDDHVVLLELGFGGYEYRDRGGAGMRMFHEWMPNAKIISTDKFMKNEILDERADFILADLSNQVHRKAIMQSVRNPNIIIDDASHLNRDVINCFYEFFPHLAPGGVYVIEDIESSWWEDHGFDGAKDLDDTKASTSINMLRNLLLSVNRKYIPAQPGQVAAPISRMDFRPNICFIHKAF